MLLNKDIIIRFILGFIFFAITIRVLGPIIFDILKNKIPGSYNPENDIDGLIRSQKEKLKAQYGLNSNGNEKNENHVTNEIENLFKESKWGGGTTLKAIQAEITKNYSYTIAESKINAFVLLCEKRSYLSFLSTQNQKSNEAIKNYLSVLLIFLMLIEEIRTKNFSFIANIARRCNVLTQEFALSIQLKLLLKDNQKNQLREDKIFNETLILGQFSDETIKKMLHSVLKNEANLWAKGHSLFLDELTLYLQYAHILIPLPPLKNKNDIETSHAILGTNDQMDLENIKKLYKKIALAKHPDKIGAQKLPAILEKKAIQKFSRIQEAYEVITKIKG